MTTISNLVAPRAAFTVQKKQKNKARTVQVRQSREEEGYDSDSESFTKRTMRRGMRKRTLMQRSQSSPSQLARPLRRRQVVAPQPEPESDAEDDEEESEDEEESAVDGESSDSSSDSDADGVESGESDSSLDSISSGSEDEESEEEEEEEETPSPGAENTESAPANPGFQTLVPGGGPSQTGEESLQPTQSSSTSVEAIPAATTTTTRPTEPTGEPTDTIVNEGPIPDSESTSSIIEATSTIVNGEGSSLPTGETSSSDPASASQIGDSDSGSPRGADIGIVLGTLAIAALIIAAGIFFYRKRRQSNMDHIERLPDEKALPPEPPTFRLSAPAPPRFPRTQSSIMDEAMGAAYQADNQGYVQNDLSRDFQPAAYEQNMKPALAVAVAPVSPVSPDSPRANNLSPRWTPASPRAQQQQQQMANFQLYPATTAPPMVPPLPAARVQGQPFMSSNQQFRFDQPRMSVARTETTEGEEGTWSTFANERMRANGGKLPFKERVLGHF